MTTKSSLQVRPLRRYIKPRYPSYNDPNPLAHPYAQPYPFSKHFVQWALASGLVGASALSADAQQTNPAPPLKNPFTLRSLGLPYQPMMFGTGLPERLNEKDVRAAAKRAFEAEGIKLDSAFLWHEGTQELRLDAYDTVSHIGYVVLPHYKLGPGTERDARWRHDKELKDASWIEQHKAYFRKMKSSQDARKSLLEYLKDMDPVRVPESRRGLYKGLADQLQDNIDSIVETETFTNLILDGTFHRVRASYLPELEAIIEQTITTNRKSIQKDGLNRIQILVDHQMLREQRPMSDPKMAEFNEAYNLIIKAAFELSGVRQTLETKDRWDLLARIQRTLFNVQETQEEPAFMQKVKSALANGTKWAALEALGRYIDQIQASMDEIEAITMEAEAGKRFVAMIDWFGPHTEVKRGFLDKNDMPPYPQTRPDWKDLDKETRSKLIMEREKAYDAARKKANEYAEEIAVQRLENEIRQFIQWARQEGKY
jgi:hypothetical protein